MTFRMLWNAFLFLGMCLFPACQNNPSTELRLEDLEPDQSVNGFRVLNLYEDGSEQILGARFINEKSGFLVDFLRIQSVPQGFMWVKSIPLSDRGEPHACEHLLLGKGKQGRYVAALEDMTLGSSSAWTSQITTVYHFNTLAGEDGFYSTLEARLKALLAPSFTDEEIRREVCHIGVSDDPADGRLTLEEKGTVYTEMISSFEGPGYPLWGTMSDLLYGKDHPLANSAGGHPDSMRTMVPKDLRDFHRECYHLSNMGMIVAIPSDMDLSSFLNRTGGLLERCQPGSDSSPTPGIGFVDLPPPSPSAQPGHIEIIPYASENPEDRGRILYGWQPDLEYDNFESFLLDHFLDAFAGGSDSNLYDLFINSQTRTMDIGATGTFGYNSAEPGHPIFFGISGVENGYITEKSLAEIRNLMVNEVQKLASFEDNSEDLRKFNDRVASLLDQSAKGYERSLNSPPMFGYRRGTAGRWQSYLEFLEREGGFRKSLVLKNHFAHARQLLDSKANFWRSYIDHWKLISMQPVSVGVYPDAGVLKKASLEKEQRLASILADFKKKYGTQNEQEAIAAYKSEFDKNSEALELLAAEEEIPKFIDNPPLTLDDQLDYQVIQLPGGIELVASTFENMTFSTVGLALKMDVVPESHLVYLPLLPSIITEIGVEKDGRIVPYTEMMERLRREVMNYNAHYDVGRETGRIELVLDGGAGDPEEIVSLLEWMEASLYAPYLNVENLPRLRDIVDQSLVSLRGMMQGGEESWVDDPANAYRFQDNPLYLSTRSFLTRAHHFQKLQWLLRDAGTEDESRMIAQFLDDLRRDGDGKSRDELLKLLQASTIPSDTDYCRKTCTKIVETLQACLPDSPDADLENDWRYVCDQIKEDLAAPPQAALDGLNEVMELLLRTDNARFYMISNTANREGSIERLKEFAGKLDDQTSSIRQTYSSRMNIFERLAKRENLTERPVYVGLINKNTRNGTLVFSAANTAIWNPEEESILDCLTGRLYGGSGGHGLFMKTWAAGLAYSNGYGYGSQSGRVSYYAERCPDVAQTMRFVVDILKNAEIDEKLMEYAVAGSFSGSRAAGPYETRGIAMASDLVDHFGPEVVNRYRQAVLDARKIPDLAGKLNQRMERVYGQVLAGYGPKLKESRDGVFFLIGPDEQFASLEEYIATAEEPQSVHKLYPRDFWLVGGND
ncbi:MAG: hypothetical protein KJ970_16380 [Candidatus Eisenbacteria bacterium]|uniref:Peptidase M16C associated domain-containing protein n=1 Tax=Eiseniibacteriota bacterium TaxID=2212470 RepID=A0A948WE69_UNCEI|nr:hypothetical protein [Candidatus Eisenbacteria bacterium]MBU2692498.1 hypothetical protein [Candidatus Eisenbacteria bacterium]